MSEYMEQDLRELLAQHDYIITEETRDGMYFARCRNSNGDGAGVIGCSPQDALMRLARNLGLLGDEELRESDQRMHGVHREMRNHFDLARQIRTIKKQSGCEN